MARIGVKRKAEFREEKQIVSVSRDDTQPADDLMGEVDNDEKPYARLIGVRNGVINIELYNKSFTCGRGGTDIPVNYSFSALNQDQGLYKYISKSQFSIIRNFEKEETIIYDNSRNGTLVNHEIVGKGKCRTLKNGDLISIGIPKLIVFVYEDYYDNVYPDELTKKYHITNHSLGKGGYGKVVLGYKKNDKSVVAIKLVNTQFSLRCSRAVAKTRDIKNEVNVMKKLNHPNIVKIFDYFHVEKSSYIVIEYVGGGEFFSKIVDPQYNRMGLGESLGKYYAYQLITAIKYLHSLGICHRDIKPENILCTQKTERCILKLTDFGMAKSVERMKTKCGTPSYNAPEIVANEGIEYTPKVDVWSLGCVLFIAFSGYPPFSEEYEDMSIDDQVLKGRLIFHAQWRRISQETQKIIRSMLTVNPTDRVSAEDLLQNKWMQCVDSRRARYDILLYSRETQIEYQNKKMFVRSSRIIFSPIFSFPKLYRSPKQNLLRCSSTQPQKKVNSIERPSIFELDGQKYETDSKWNLSPAVRHLLNRQILKEESNPLNLLKRRIVNYVSKTYRKPGNRSPLFTICETEPRVVTTYQNFDSLLTPKDHVSRRSSDTYYVNEKQCLRAHTSAHQHSLMQQGLDAFLVIGDVYRRDEIDRTHYPCFHQIEGVRLYSKDELLGKKANKENVSDLFVSKTEKRTAEKQETHSIDAAKASEIQLKEFLENLCDDLFGKKCEKRWIDAYFPFTHPSYELEIFYNGQWLEVLGCGIMEQKLLESAGVTDKIGWAFGIGLERIAMVLYEIPDIRLLWSKDSGFLSQFSGKNPEDRIVYKEISSHPQVIFDVSFFLPENVQFNDMTSDVYDTIRTIGGELVEQVKLIDEFENKKNQKKSQTYRIVYRSHEKALTKEEVNVIHKRVEKTLSDNFGVYLR